MKILFSLNIHVEPHGEVENLENLAYNVVPHLYSKYGIKPTFAIQVEPEECGKKIDLFRQHPLIVEELNELGEIGLHSHFEHDRSHDHQKFHIYNALKKGEKFSSLTWVSGDWLTDRNTLKILEEFNVKIDSSFLVGKLKLREGAYGHSWRSPRIPYYPSKSNIYRPSNKNHFNVLEIPNTLLCPDALTTTRMQYHTEEQIERVQPIRNEIPVILPCHSYDFLVQERLRRLERYLSWLTENYDVKVGTMKDFLNYPHLKQGEYSFTWKDLAKDLLRYSISVQ